MGMYQQITMTHVFSIMMWKAAGNSRQFTAIRQNPNDQVPMICQPSPWGLKFGTILASEIQIGHESSHHNWIVDHSEPLLTMIAVTTINHYQPLLALAEPNHPFFSWLIRHLSRAPNISLRLGSSRRPCSNVFFSDHLVDEITKIMNISICKYLASWS